MSIEKIRFAVNTCDPADLLSHAPLDEYENEIMAVAKEIEFRSARITSSELADIITRVFVEAFDDSLVNVDACRRAAKMILE